MKRIAWKNRSKKASVGKVVIGMVLGSVVGATVGLLMAPVSGRETRHKLTGQATGIQEKTKVAAGNIESRARDLAGEVSRTMGGIRASISRRGKVGSTTSQE